MSSMFCTTKKYHRNYLVALFIGFLGGNLASFVKWGTENPMPPRTPDRAIPPAEMLHSLGFDTKSMVYNYSQHVVNWGIGGVHHLFSVFFGMLYCVLAEIFPIVKLWQGAAFALVVTIVFHGIILPVAGWSPAFWHLPIDEIASETIGHILWMWAIEVVRRDIRNRITKKPDPECY